MYLRGEGITRNYQKAFKWCQLAANQGNVNAQANLGLMYGHGKGLDQDYHQAAKWYRLAAEL
jgi:TPR repeat protein